MSRWVLGPGMALLVGCVPSQEDRRPELLEQTVTGGLSPAIADAKAGAANLHEASLALCGSPSQATLDAARDAWWATRGPWKRLIVLPVGPVVEEGYDSALDFWPARPSSIEGGIETGASTQAEIDMLGVASKGLPAIEYLLWDPVGEDAAILAGLSEDSGGAERCAYLELLSADLELGIEALDTQLQVFFTELKTAGATGNLRYPTVALAIDELLNAAIAGLHDLGERALSKPAGLGEGTQAQPDQLESRFSDRSRTDILDALEGVRRFYLGAEAGAGEGLGFSILVEGPSPSIDARVRAQLDRAIAAAEAIPEPLSEAIDADRALVETAETEIRALRILLTADVAGLIGVTVALTDNDGD